MSRVLLQGTPGGPERAESLYFILSGSYVFLFTLFVTVNLVFQTQEAGLTALQLVLVGTTLEATTFLCEVPTGVVADAKSRRLSILIGLVLMGAGMILNGSFAMFETLLLAQVVWGLGFTFMSGARQAWLADEIGPQRAGAIYLRSAQIEQVARLAAIPIAVGLGTIALNLPILIAGIGLIPLALFLWLVMPESFKPDTSDASVATRWGRMFTTFAHGAGQVRRRPLLITILFIAAFYGMSTEGFDRLWVAHFYRSLGFPGIGELEPVVWFGFLRIGAALIGLVVIQAVRRARDFNDHKLVSRLLLVTYVIQFAGLAGFTVAGSFEMGMLAFWALVSVGPAYDALFISWINQNVDSSARATVISMASQTNSLGQIGGGPPLGVIADSISLRAAFWGAVTALVPGLLLYVRSLGQGNSDATADSEVREPSAS